MVPRGLGPRTFRPVAERSDQPSYWTSGRHRVEVQKLHSLMSGRAARSCISGCDSRPFFPTALRASLLAFLLAFSLALSALKGYVYQCFRCRPRRVESTRFNVPPEVKRRKARPALRRGTAWGDFRALSALCVSPRECRCNLSLSLSLSLSLPGVSAASDFCQAASDRWPKQTAESQLHYVGGRELARPPPSGQEGGQCLPSPPW